MDENFTAPSAVFNYLLEIGCCRLCCFRYLNITSREYYFDIDKGLQQLGFKNAVKSSDEKKKKDNTCVACVGLLQNVEDLAETIAKNKEIANYDNAAFAIAISLPITVSIRSHSVRVSLEEKFLEKVSKPEVPLKEVWKWFIGPLLEKKINKTFSSGANCDFLINVNIGYKDDSKEMDSLLQINPEMFETRKKQSRKFRGETFTRKSIDTLLEKTKNDVFKNCYSCPPTIPDEPMFFESLTFTHNSIYFAGRYLKFSRELSQSPWIINNVRMMESSVQEIIMKPLTDKYGILEDNIVFSSSGREDCDVRCLGKGRPFVLEIVNPKKSIFTAEEIKELQTEINTSSLVQVRDMQIVPKEELVHLKTGEESKTKIYQALCVSKKSLDQSSIDLINSQKELIMQQKTPIRVLHRRPLAIRPKIIYFMSAQLVPGSKNIFTLDVETQAGTYVKEFVHGDFGRSKPSLSSLLDTEVDIIALDVTSIKLDWPKTIA